MFNQIPRVILFQVAPTTNPTFTSSTSVTPYTPMDGPLVVPMAGGGKKRKAKKTPLRRKVSKKAKRMNKIYIKSKKQLTRRMRKKQKRLKTRSARVNIIKSVESGLDIPVNSKKQLSPSMQAFLDGIESTGSTSTLRFSNFKSEPKKKSKKSKKKSKKNKTMVVDVKNVINVIAVDVVIKSTLLYYLNFYILY